MTKRERYNCSEKGRARNRRYEATAAALRRKMEYDVLRGRKITAVAESALAEREEYEASGTSLSFIEWLDETYPLPKQWRAISNQARRPVTESVI